MAAATPYYRIPVVIFAMLVGGLYVYAKGGGTLLQRRTQVTPAANSHGEALAPPKIEFMMGPKSAPAFDQSSNYQPAKPQPKQIQATPSRQVLPGSKSRAVIDPPTYTPGSTAPNAVPPPANAAPRARVLPGSKSMILIDPQTIAPSTNRGVSFPPSNTKPQPVQQQAQPVQPAPPTRVLPGSKSAILIEPSTIVPPPAQPKPAPRQPAYQQPTYQPPARGNQQVQPRTNNFQQRAVER